MYGRGMRVFCLTLLAVSSSAQAGETVQVPVPSAVTHPLPEFIAYDQNKDGVLTLSEYAKGRWPLTLRHFDRDHDGRVASLEWVDGTCYDDVSKDPETIRRFRNQCIEEMKAEFAPSGFWDSGDDFPDIRFQFRVWDCNRDGRVSAQEHALASQSVCPKPNRD